ncbi:MAG TPA: 5-(carboxyamino)imidazole ribonucleotide mutase [Acidimicrobiales bacterium]
MSKKVAILMGSKSDLDKMRPAQETLEELGIELEVWAMSAHRTPSAVSEFCSSARENGIGVIIAAAGMAAALPGTCAAFTTLPVVGVPLSGSKLDGVDALYAIVQMPPGMPVATVAIDGARNAALLAAQILAVEDATVAEKLAAARSAWSPERLA